MPKSQLSNLRDVTTRLGTNKWKRAGQILRSYGISGFIARLKEKMERGIDAEAEAEAHANRRYILSNESVLPRRARQEVFPTESMVSFSVEPAADNASLLEIMVESRGTGGQVRLEVFHDGTRLSDASVPAPPGVGYVSIPFAPVIFPSTGSISFVVSITGDAGIIVDRRHSAYDFRLAGGGRVFARLYASTDPVYDLWMYYNDPSPEELARQRATVFSYEPLFSIVVPLFNTPHRYMREMIDSVLAQTYPEWELCLADGSTDGVDRASVAASFGDSRIRYRKLAGNEGIAGNTNRAVEMARGDFVCLLDHDDLLAPHALFANAALLQNRPECDLIYSDEDKISDTEHRRFFPYFKPDFSPNLLNSFNYITHFCVIRRSMMEQSGWFRQGFDGAQDYDLILRAAELARDIGHIPDILYHWRTAPTSTAASAETKNYTEAAALRALADSLERRAVAGAEPVASIQPNRFGIHYPIPEPAPAVSIILPVSSGWPAAKRSAEAILESTNYTDFEVILVSGADISPRSERAMHGLLQDPRVRVICCPDKHGSASLLNAAAAQARGELITFLAPQITGLSDGWLDALVSQALRPGVGAAGGIICAEDGSIRHAGYTLHAGDIAGSAMQGFPPNHPGPLGLLFSVRDVSAVSAECMIVRKDTFLAAGGYEERYQSAFSDVDLCLRLREAGSDIVFTPDCRIRTMSRTEPRDEAVLRDDRQLWLSRWLAAYPEDPYGNPNLSCERADYSTWPGPRGEAVRQQIASYEGPTTQPV